MSFCQYLVCPKPQGDDAKEKVTTRCGWGVHKSRKYSYCVAFYFYGMHLFHLVTFILMFIGSVCFTIFSLDIAYWHNHHSDSQCISFWRNLSIGATTARRCIAPASRASRSLNQLRKLRELTSTIIWNDPLVFCWPTHWGSGPYSELVLNLEAVVAMPLAQQRKKTSWVVWLPCRRKQPKKPEFQLHLKCSFVCLSGFQVLTIFETQSHNTTPYTQTLRVWSI